MEACVAAHLACTLYISALSQGAGRLRQDHARNQDDDAGSSCRGTADSGIVPVDAKALWHQAQTSMAIAKANMMQGQLLIDIPGKCN